MGLRFGKPTPSSPASGLLCSLPAVLRHVDDVLTGDVAVELGHADGQALERDGVAHREAVALDVAGHEQAGDDLALGVVDAALLVALEAAHGHEHDGGHEGTGVEGRVLQREQTAGVLAEVGVGAGFAHLVVALDGGKRSLPVDVGKGQEGEGTCRL